MKFINILLVLFAIGSAQFVQLTQSAFAMVQADTSQSESLTNISYLNRYTPVVAVSFVNGENSHGSGICLGSNLILTNYHVVYPFGNPSPAEISIINADRAKTIVTEMNLDLAFHDLALLKTLEPICPGGVKIYNGKPLDAGEPVSLFGHPGKSFWVRMDGQLLDQTKLSNDKSFNFENCDRLSPDTEILSSDISSAPGTSGGGLYKTDSGELIGINFQGTGHNSTLDYSRGSSYISVNYLKEFATRRMPQFYSLEEIKNWTQFETVHAGKIASNPSVYKFPKFPVTSGRTVAASSVFSLEGSLAIQNSEAERVADISHLKNYTPVVEVEYSNGDIHVSSSICLGTNLLLTAYSNLSDVPKTKITSIRVSNPSFNITEVETMNLDLVLNNLVVLKTREPICPGMVKIYNGDPLNPGEPLTFFGVTGGALYSRIDGHLMRQNKGFNFPSVIRTFMLNASLNSDILLSDITIGAGSTGGGIFKTQSGELVGINIRYLPGNPIPEMAIHISAANLKDFLTREDLQFFTLEQVNLYPSKIQGSRSDADGHTFPIVGFEISPNIKGSNQHDNLQTFAELKQFTKKTAVFNDFGFDSNNLPFLIVGSHIYTFASNRSDGRFNMMHYAYCIGDQHEYIPNDSNCTYSNLMVDSDGDGKLDTVWAERSSRH